MVAKIYLEIIVYVVNKSAFILSFVVIKYWVCEVTDY